MKPNIHLFLLTFISLLFIGFLSCHYKVPSDFRKNYSDINEALHSDTSMLPFFKVHFKNGDVSVMEDWQLNASKDSLLGHGKLFDFNRHLVHEGALSCPIDTIALIETNQLSAIKSKDESRIAALAVVTGANLIMDVICITNPKACFGSCPTFYTDKSASVHDAKAEGFSNAIAPSFERKDIDALQYETSDCHFSLTMKNEAFETHMINQIQVLGVPKKRNQTTYHDLEGNYYLCGQPRASLNATVNSKDISSLVCDKDQLEYYSPTDSNDLSAKETMVLEFATTTSNQQGLVLNYRQTLLTTFLLYSGLSYMGDEVGDYFSKIETSTRYQKWLTKPFEKLGGIKISIWHPEDKRWEEQKEIYETGPIANNLVLLPLPFFESKDSKIKIKLEMTKGLWRLDYLGLTDIQQQIEPTAFTPTQLSVIEGEPYTLEDIVYDDQRYLISFPGNVYDFHYELPELSTGQVWDLYLSSKGYYLEWMRREWLKGKDLPKLKKMLMNDPSTWHELAREFKSMESDMETVFWNSYYSNI